MSSQMLTGLESIEERVRLTKAALVVMIGDGVPEAEAASLVLAALQLNKNPEAFAKHFVKLRVALREVAAKGQSR